jgi:DNA-binding NarL/FixJ family response regulator
MTTMTKSKIKVMLVEDHILIRMGMDTLAQLEPDIEIVGHVEEGEEAVACFGKCRPDVVIIDMRLPGELDGAETITALRKEFSKVIVLVLSSYASDDDVYRAVRAGVSGYLLKDGHLPTLVEAIRAVHAGRQFFPPNISERLAENLRHAMLTERELTVLKSIAKGMSNKEIGSAFNITEGTVKSHITNILDKLQAADRTQALATAIKRGIIHID